MKGFVSLVPEDWLRLPKQLHRLFEGFLFFPTEIIFITLDFTNFVLYSKQHKIKPTQT